MGDASKFSFSIYSSMMKASSLMEKCWTGAYYHSIQELSSILKEKRFKKYYFLGTGSSYLAGISEAYFARELLEVDAESWSSTDFGVYQQKHISNKNGVVFLNSHSGKSREDARIVSKCREIGLYTIAVTDVLGTLLTESVDFVLLGPGGPKHEMPSTRTYNLAMYRVFMALALVDAENNQSLLKELQRMPAATERVIKKYDAEGNKLAEELKRYSNFLVLSQGTNLSTAQECAMGLTQATGLPAQGLLLEEYLHGQVQGFSKGTVIILIAPDGLYKSRIIDFSEVASMMGGKVYILAPEGTNQSMSYTLLAMPDGFSEIVTPVMNIVPFWYVGFYLTILNKRDPDLLMMKEEGFPTARLAEYKTVLI